MKIAVFFERDGVLNAARVERKHQIGPLTLEDFHINPSAAELLQRLKKNGLVLIATTNQPGISRGYQSRRELDRMHETLLRTLPLDDVLVCPHDETDRCPCRKPKSGLFMEASFKWHLDLDHSFVVSDKWQDSEAARSVGCTSLMIESPWLRAGHRDLVLPDLEAAVEKVLRLRSIKNVMVA